MSSQGTPSNLGTADPEDGDLDLERRSGGRLYTMIGEAGKGGIGRIREGKRG